MELHEALRQIGTIRTQVARTEVFRGYKAATVGCTGLVALAVAALQPLLVPDPRNEVGRYLAVWIGVAAASVALVAHCYWRICGGTSRLTPKEIYQ